MTLVAGKHRGRIERALDAADATVRLFLLYGPDEAGSRALAARLASAMGEGAERIDLTGAALKADPARLADEAAAFSMFGDKRWVRVDPAGDEAADAVAALLEASAAGNPAVLIAGELRKDAKLVKLVSGAAAALGFASYAPEGREADQLAVALARAEGLTLAPEVARRLVALAGGDRAVLAQEIAKYALYLDATPDRTRELGHAAIDALAAASDEGDLDRLARAVLGGDPAGAADELTRLTDSGVDGVRLIRALQKRVLLLTELAAEVAEGNSIDTVVKGNRSIFWKEQDNIMGELRRWTPAALATALDRVAAAGLATMAAGGPGPIAADAVAIDVARVAARRR